MKLITKINELISIWSDQKQYVVKIGKGSKPDYWYFPTLDSCFVEIFDYQCKTKLANGKNKTLRDIAEIILNTRKEILEIIAPFQELKPKK